MQRVCIFALLIIASLFLMQCTDEGNAESNTEESSERSIPVKTMQLQKQSFANYLEVTGVVHARNHVQIIVEEPGILRKVIVDKGRYASANDTLAVLENKVLEAQYEQAQAALQQAELEYKSRDVLYKKRAISENEFLGAKYSLNAAKAAYNLAKVRYEKLFITAPLRGIVNERYYDRGAYANAMTPIFEFIDNDYLKIRAGVAERFLGDIKIGTPVELTFDAYPDMKVEAKVSFVSRSIDPSNRTFQVEVVIPNKGRKLAPEMIANVRVLREEFPNSIVVPLDALIESENGWHVFVANQDRAKKVVVDQRAIYRNSVLVEGLSSNDKLIVVGHRNLSDGALLDFKN